jgi:hypothetical protein
MSRTQPLSGRSLGHRASLLLAALAVTVGIFVAAVAGPVPQAHATGAEYFCYYLAAPYGSAGDRCYSSNAHWLILVRSYGYWHSACSDAWKEGLVAEWSCAPTANWSNSWFDGSRFMLGVVRNNTTGANNQLWGYMEYN